MEKISYGYVEMMVKYVNRLGIILKTFETPGNVIGFAFGVHQNL